MKNQDRYKTAQERAEAFEPFCAKSCEDCSLYKLDITNHSMGCAFAWLDLEAEEEKPLPCPFCGAECKTLELFLEKDHYVVCDKCRYASSRASTEHEAIAAHNRVAKAVRESEAKA